MIILSDRKIGIRRKKGKMKMRIETARLIITEFRADMAEEVHRNSLDEDTRRFTPDEVFLTIGEAEETIRHLIRLYEGQNGPLVYPVLRKDGVCVGYVQAVKFDDGQWEIGYHIGSPYTRKGYATEAVRAFLPVIMKKIGITRIKGICLRDNLASIKVLERSGFIRTYEGEGLYQGRKQEICAFIYFLSPKEVISRFFEEGYERRNYDFILHCLSERYVDHSPAAARSNLDAVGILKIVAEQFSDLRVKISDLFSEGNMVATRVLYEGIHTGICMGIPPTGKRIAFEALENFKVEEGIITESWGYWPDKEIEQKLSEK